MGSVDYDESRVIKKGRLGPGQIFCVDTTRGLVMNDEEITRYFANRKPYAKWVEQNLLPLSSISTPTSYAPSTALPPSAGEMEGGLLEMEGGLSPKNTKTNPSRAASLPSATPAKRGLGCAAP
ncbi:MAG: hypothetical protein ACO3VR_07695 [Lutimaribacter sp.]